MRGAPRHRLKLVVLLFFLCSWAGQSIAQQAPLFTKYVFNSLAFNPAYAGSKGFFSSNLIYRSQWANIEGAPSTLGLSLHSPLSNDRIGLGLNIIQDQIGPSQRSHFNLAYAYRVPFNRLKLSVGLQAGFKNLRADFNQLRIENPVDGAFYELEPSWILPNVGLGVYLSGEYFYAGLGIPELIEYDLSTAPNFEQYVREIRHFYLHGGWVWPINNDLKFKPSFLFRTVGWFSRTDPLGNPGPKIAAPSEIDLDLSVLMYDIFWVGLSFRTAMEIFSSKTASPDSADIWMAWYAPKGFRFGLAYDFTVSPLATETIGSLEIMFGYEFNYRKRGVVTPRYF